jgi:hypothetical protein
VGLRDEYVLAKSLFKDARESDVFVGVNSLTAGSRKEESLLVTLLGGVGSSDLGVYQRDDLSPPLPVLAMFSGVSKMAVTSGGRSVRSDLLHISNEVAI